MILLLSILLMIASMSSWSALREAYDAEQWAIGTPDYCRCGATNREVIIWAWQRWRHVA